MNQQQSSKKTVIIFIVIIIIGVFIYFYTLGEPTDTSESSINTTNTEELANTQAVGVRVLSLLNQINSLKIDSTIFDGAVYQSLVDYTVIVPEQPIGRNNPFTPFYTPSPVLPANRNR